MVLFVSYGILAGSGGSKGRGIYATQRKEKLFEQCVKETDLKVSSIIITLYRAMKNVLPFCQSPSEHKDILSKCEMGVFVLFRQN